MDIRELDRHDEAALRAFWAVGKAAEDASRPYDFYVPWEGARIAYERARPGFSNLLLGAYDGERMVGRAYLNFPELDNTHLAFADIHVHPDHQRRGVGRRLVEVVEDRARRYGRKTLLCEAYSPLGEDGPALRFARVLGFTEALEDGMKVVDLVETEPLWDEIEAELAGRTAGYTLVPWRDFVPQELIPGYCALNEAFNDEAPTGELDLEPESWDEERVVARARQNVDMGRIELAVAAIAPDGTMAGLTEIALSRFATHRGFQSGTLVLPSHRGHGLGLAMKVANHRALRAAFPECRVLLTGNAGVNIAMNAVNERLGYREIERCVEMQKELV